MSLYSEQDMYKILDRIAVSLENISRWVEREYMQGLQAASTTKIAQQAVQTAGSESASKSHQPARVVQKATQASESTKEG